MSQKKKFRSPLLASGDDHGVSDLLREVAKRNNSSLTDKERKEVSAMVKRVEEHAERKTPIGKLKKKIKDVTKIAGETSDETSVGSGDDDNESHKSSNTAGASESVNKWGKDLVQKFSNMQTSIPNPLHKDEAAASSAASSSASASSSHTPKLDPKEVFRNFATKLKSKEPTAANKEKAKRLEAMKEAFEKSSREAFERSSQSGRDMLHNFSKNFENFQNTLSSNMMNSSQQQHPPEATIDKTSAEYKLDVKGIALLKEIFPDESTENLIKMHYGHLQSGQKR